jgi:pimeloyl-ACP methyl ester carboxylesterase
VFGGQVFFAEAGPVGAATVVLVHGLGDSAGRDWHPILPALSEHHHVVVFDLPGLEVRGRRAAVVATGPTSLLFSVSRVESRRTRAFVHGVQELARNDEL